MPWLSTRANYQLAAWKRLTGCLLFATASHFARTSLLPSISNFHCLTQWKHSPNLMDSSILPASPHSFYIIAACLQKQSCENNLPKQETTSGSGKSTAFSPRTLAPAQIASKDIARFHPLTKPMENGGSSSPGQHQESLPGSISSWHRGTEH